MYITTSQENLINYSKDTFSTSSQYSELEGGKNQKWKHILENIGHVQEEQHNSQPIGETMGGLAYELKKTFDRNNPIVIDPTRYESLPELFNAVADHAKRWQRLSTGNLSTIEHRMRCARRMTKHLVFPIDFLHLDYGQFIAYMQYREDHEHAQHFALKNDLQAIQMFLHAYGIDSRTWFYRLPIRQQHKERILPLPDIVYAIINHKYHEDKYTNALYQYLHAHNFWIGWRVPSEPCLIKVSDIDVDTGSLIITERKKHYSKRQIFPENVIMKGQTRKSFKNWIDHWRPKVENQYSDDYLYLQPSGKPFTSAYLGKQLRETGQQVYEHYTPYISRHWCAVARLIQTKIQTGHYDCYVVKNWLGHDKISTTEGYIQHAENYYRIGPYDWIKHTLKFDKIEGESAFKSKQGLKTSVSSGNPPRDEDGLVGI